MKRFLLSEFKSLLLVLGHGKHNGRRIIGKGSFCIEAFKRARSKEHPLRGYAEFVLAHCASRGREPAAGT